MHQLSGDGDTPFSSPFFNARMRRIHSIACLFLLALGFLLSFYLLARYAQMIAPESQGVLDICAAVFGASCDDTLASPFSVQFGLPLPGWGLIYDAILLCLLLISWFTGTFLRLAASAFLVFVTLVGGILSLFLATFMLVGAVPACPACYAIHLVNVLLIPVAFMQTGFSGGEILGAWRAGARYVFGGELVEPDLAAGRILGLLVPFLVGLVVYQGVLIQLQMRAGAEMIAIQADQVLASYEATPVEAIPSDPDDAAWGRDDAPAELVVFSDFQCPACADFAFETEALRRQFESELRIVFKHYPLDEACNPAVEGDFHVQACWAARLAQAAHELGNFWPAHDALFGMLISEDHEAVVEAVASASDLDTNRLRETMDSAAIEAKVANDIQAGIDLGIPGTPTVFLNGRRLHDTRPEALRLLILHLAHSEEGVASAP